MLEKALKILNSKFSLHKSLVVLLLDLEFS